MTERTAEPGFYAGAELSAETIRAAVFTSAFRLAGKRRAGTKSGRGIESVIERLARCIADAADECDLSLPALKGVGVAVCGQVDAGTGRILHATELGWSNVPLQAELERRLRLPVKIESCDRVCTLGVFLLEMKARPARFAAVFVGRSVAGSCLVNGKFQDFPEELITRTTPIDRLFPSERAFRKALRQRDKAARDLAKASAALAAALLPGIIEQIEPEMIALGGYAIEELGEELLSGLKEAAARPASQRRPQITVSTLGDKAPLAGAALLAAGMPSAQNP